MANFLNTDGLSALWAKIKSKFYTKTEVDALIPEDEIMKINVTSSGSGENISYSADKTYNEINTAFRNGKTCIVIYNNERVLYLVGKTSTAFIFSMIAGANATLLTNYIIKITNTQVSLFLKTSQPSVTTPEMDGTATVGVSNDYARADHVHPTDTSRVATNASGANDGEAYLISQGHTNEDPISIGYQANGGIQRGFLIGHNYMNIVGLDSPINDNDAATKKYVDDSIPASDIFWVNIEYTSGSGDQTIYTADKSYGEVHDAIDNGKYVVAYDGGQIYYWDGYYYTSFVNDEGSYYLRYFHYIYATDEDNTLYASVYSWADASSMENKADVWDVLTKTNTTSYTPTADYHPATKKYVDDSIPASELFIVNISYDSVNQCYVADKTYTETSNAWSAGKLVYAKDSNGHSCIYDGECFKGIYHDEDFARRIEYYYNYNSNYELDYTEPPIVEQNWVNNYYLGKYNTDSYTPTGNYNPATKKYVDDSIGSITVPTASTTTPLMNGTAAIGSSTNYAKADHVHPSDTSKLTRHVSQNGGLEHSTISNLYNQFTVQVANDGGGLVNNFTLTPTSTTINNVVTPTSDGMAANKKYVDDSISGISTDLSGLSDTAISSPTEGQVLSYNSTSSKWVNSNISNTYFFRIDSSENHDTMTVTYDEVYAAYQSGKAVYAINGAFLYHLCNANAYGMGFVGYYNGFINRYDWSKENDVITYERREIIDVSVSSPSNGQLLVYDSTTSKWINTTSSYATETRVNELISAALAQYGDGDTASYGYTDASEVNY